ncbi:MAG: radical SAM protein [Myxococcales bacterium]|nr:radical SAM protein [Myxococcales bacterium]MCB9736046.1 radical SAM protein [Deltaproteobacteria bacterium]
MLNRLRFSPFLAQLVVVRRCNLACKYCNEFDTTSQPVPLDELKRRVDKLKELGTFSIEFTGGEPMLHPGIYDLIRYAREKRFHKVMMISNAYLMNEEKVRKLNDAGLEELQISVDGVTPNDITVKVLKPLRKKLEVIAKTAKFKVVLSGVLGAAPAADVLEVAEFAKAHGFRPRVLVLHGEDGQMKLSDEERDMFQRVKSTIGEKRFKEAHDYRERLLNEGAAPFKCRAGSRYLYVDEFGVVHWCSQTREEWGIPLADYDFEQLRTQFKTKKPCTAGCTVGCARTQSAPDEWRPQPLLPVGHVAPSHAAP